MVELEDRETFGNDLAEGNAPSYLYQTRHCGKDVFFLVREVLGDSVIIDTYDRNGKRVQENMSIPVENISRVHRVDQNYQDLANRLLK